MKKAGMIAVSLVVTAALVGGVGYGAYYTMQGQKEPVEVVPVMNVSTGYWDEEEMVYGTITSQVAQTITLENQYQIEEIYVSPGDKVKEGTPLFSYDMTLPELELEMAELDLQAKELEKVKLEKDLNKLKNTRASASLQAEGTVRTASAEDMIVDEEEGSPEASDPNQTEKKKPDSDSGISIETMETVSEVPDKAKANPKTDGISSNKGEVSLEDAAASYETLVSMIDILFRSYGESLTSADIGDAVEDCVAYYRKNLAEEKKQTDENGKIQISYELKKSVTEALSGEAAKELEKSAALMELYQIRYVEILIKELDVQNQGDFSADVQKARKQYEALTTEGKEAVQNLEHLEEMEAMAQQMPEETKAANPNDETEQPTEEGSEQQPAEGETEQPTEEGSEQQPTEDGSEQPTEGESEESTEDGSEQPVEGESEQPTEDGSEQPVEGESEESTEEGSEQQPTEEGTEQPTEDGSEQPVEGESEESTEEGSEQQPTEDETEQPTEEGTEQSTEDESEQPTEDESEKQSESETEEMTEVESESETEKMTETESESETEKMIEYPVTIKNGQINDEEDDTVLIRAGETVTITAKSSESHQMFMGWKAEPDEVKLADASAEVTTFVMPERAVEIEAFFEDQVELWIRNYLSLAETALGADGVTPEEYHADDLETALIFYQANLSVATNDIVDGSTPSMEQYQLSQSAQRYLTEKNQESEITYLQERYKTLCMMFVKTLVGDLDPQNLNWADLNRAKEAYESLGDTWRSELDQSVYEEPPTETEPSDGDVSYNGETAPIPMGEDGDPTGNEPEAPGFTVVTYGERLAAYEVILKIQELDPKMPEELLVEKLRDIRDTYLIMNDSQKAVIWNSEALIELLKEYHLWEEEPETEDPFWPDEGGFGDFGEGPLYTAEELKELIEEKEREIKTCDLDIREKELKVEQSRRIVDGKVVKSTMDGTVISIGALDGSSETDGYFAKVANTSGLYLKGTIDELAVSNLQEGDTVTGNASNGMSFTAVIKEVSEYPDPNGANNLMYYSGSMNTNVAYYPFYALIEDAEGIEEGDATFQFSSSGTESSEKIYLPKYMVRDESDGRSYVYLDDNGKLKKQYVSTGKTIYDYAIEINGGLSMEDSIAFPYGNDVTEGAATKEVDNLTALSE